MHASLQYVALFVEELEIVTEATCGTLFQRLLLLGLCSLVEKLQKHHRVHVWYATLGHASLQYELLLVKSWRLLSKSCLICYLLTRFFLGRWSVVEGLQIVTNVMSGP